LVRSDIQKVIDQCDSLAKAIEIVNSFGGTYFHAATFGATLTMSTKSEDSSFSSSDELSVALETEAKCLKAGIFAKGKFQIGHNKGQQNKRLDINITAYGGDPAHVLKGDVDKWIASTVDNPGIVNFELAPISHLAISNSPAEKFLLEAVQELCNGELGKFKLSGFESGVYALQAKQGNHYLNCENCNDGNGGKIYQWDYPQKWTIMVEDNDDCLLCPSKVMKPICISTQTLVILEEMKAKSINGIILRNGDSRISVTTVKEVC
jgi:hypothetical protein